MQSIFKKSELFFSIESGLLKVAGLKNLPGHQAEEIRQEIRKNKKEIMLALKCPARCKTTGKCYGLAYFEGQPDQVRDCEPWKCKHSNKRTKHERKIKWEVMVEH